MHGGSKDLELGALVFNFASFCVLAEKKAAVLPSNLHMLERLRPLLLLMLLLVVVVFLLPLLLLLFVLVPLQSLLVYMRLLLLLLTRDT